MKRPTALKNGKIVVLLYDENMYPMWKKTKALLENNRISIFLLRRIFSKYLVTATVVYFFLNCIGFYVFNGFYFNSVFLREKCQSHIFNDSTFIIIPFKTVITNSNLN